MWKKMHFYTGHITHISFLRHEVMLQKALKWNCVLKIVTIFLTEARRILRLIQSGFPELILVEES